MTRRKRAMSRQNSTKSWMTALVLLAFFLQGLAIQTHVHERIRPAVAKALHLPAPVPLKTQDPIDHCRLCQELVHAGTFVTPSAIMAFAALSFVAAVLAALPAFAGTPARAFAWQSRAPPRR